MFAVGPILLSQKSSSESPASDCGAGCAQKSTILNFVRGRNTCLGFVSGEGGSGAALRYDEWVAQFLTPRCQNVYSLEGGSFAKCTVLFYLA